MILTTEKEISGFNLLIIENGKPQLKKQMLF